MKNLGYFNRPASFWVFIFLSVALIILYAIFIFYYKQKSVSTSRIFYFLFFIFYLLSYPAFLSYDIFNYFFDARIIIKYRENPYLFSAGRYVFDEWLRFMRWTHRTYPYGPVWLLFSLIPIALGFGKLVPTILFFKIFNLSVFLGCIYFLRKILAFTKSNLNNVYLFALHPVIIYDFLISMHNEGLMLVFLLGSLYFFLKDRKTWSIIFLFLSVGTKFITIVFLPIYVLLWLSKSETKEKQSFLINLAPLISIISLIPLIFLREPYSWYFIVSIGLLTLDLTKTKTAILATLSLLIFRYAPFILIGEYNKTVIFWQSWIAYVVLTVVMALFLVGEWRVLPLQIWKNLKKH